MRDDDLEDPNGCTDPLTGKAVKRGTAIMVPLGIPMPLDTIPPASHSGTYPPTYGLYVCRDGHWVGIDSYRKGAIELLTDAVSVAGVKGSTVVMTGRCAYAGETAVTLTASVGSVEHHDDGGWTWQHAPDDWSDGAEVVVITATADDQTSKIAFNLTWERHPG